MNSQVHELKLMNSKFMNLTNFMNLAISCSWIVHELFMNKCSWTAHELFKNHSWTVHDHFTGVHFYLTINYYVTFYPVFPKKIFLFFHNAHYAISEMSPETLLWFRFGQDFKTLQISRGMLVYTDPGQGNIHYEHFNKSDLDFKSLSVQYYIHKCSIYSYMYV